MDGQRGGVRLEKRGKSSCSTETPSSSNDRLRPQAADRSSTHKSGSSPPQRQRSRLAEKVRENTHLRSRLFFFVRLSYRIFRCELG